MAEMRSVAVEGLEPPISKIGLGTWQFGSREWGYGKDYADEEAGRMVRRALELGVTLFDSAEIYGFGASERILGAALGERRTDVVLATKLFPLVPVPAVVRHRARASARRLGVDRIDLYQVHWPNPIVPLRQTMRGLRELVDAGVVAEVGVSNFDLARWKRAEEELGRRVLFNQVQYSLLARGPERELILWAERNGRVVIAYSPLAQGLLSGRYDPSRRPGGARGAQPALPARESRARAASDRRPEGRRRGPRRRHARPGGAGLGDPLARGGGHTRRVERRPARVQRSRRRARAQGGRGARAVHRGRGVRSRLAAAARAGAQAGGRAGGEPGPPRARGGGGPQAAGGLTAGRRSQWRPLRRLGRRSAGGTDPPSATTSMVPGSARA